MSPSTHTGPRRALDKPVPDRPEAEDSEPRRARRGPVAMMRRRVVVATGAVVALAVIGTTAVIGLSAGRSADSGLAAAPAPTSSIAAVRAQADDLPRATPSSSSAASTAQSPRNGKGVSRSEASRTPIEGTIVQAPTKGSLSSVATASPTPDRTSEASSSTEQRHSASSTEQRPSASPDRSTRTPSAKASEESSSSSRRSSSGDSSTGRSNGSSSAPEVSVGDTSGLSANTVAVMKAVKARYPQVSFITAGSQDHTTGHAVDVMVTGSLGDEIAAYVRSNASSLGVHYIIWSQKIWNVQRDAEGWRPMADRGSVTANHYDHVHVSVN